MADRPNIVLILVDDMGYSDLGCFGGDVETPQLDALARRGIRFTQFYNTARCCPARACLLTGLYPHQAGMGWMTAADLGYESYTGDLNDRCATIGEALKPAGYSTYMSGKWHLTYERYIGNDGPTHSWPRQRGFDRFFGTLAGAGSYFRPHTLRDDNRAVEAWEGFYYTDVISDKACRFISEHRKKESETPFFLYAAYTAPHWPLHAKPADIGKYRGRFTAGWDVLRRRKYEKMLEMGLLDSRWDLSERDEEVPAWDSLSETQRSEFDLKMAIYAAQVDCVDQGVGRIVSTLRDGGCLENTLILAMSDNGGCHEELHRKDAGPSDYGADESFESYGRPWANLSNVPFRLFKSWVHEGGISTPLIAHWPEGIANAGSFVRHPAHFIDVMPTCLELAGASYPPKTVRNAQPLQGASLAASLRGGQIRRENALFWEHEGNKALRKGRWKTVAKGEYGVWELYDMEEDRSEIHDLAAEEPELARELVREWSSIACSIGVFPLDGRKWQDRVNTPLVPPRG